MKTITLRLRVEDGNSIDASSLRLEELVQKTSDQIARLLIDVSSARVEMGEIFDIDCRETDDADPALILQGDSRFVHSLGHQHQVGRIIVEADIGDHCGACMSGGTITVAGNAGRYLGAPTGSRGVGMNGGRIVVSGSAGAFAGHRMRRGEMWISGTAGPGLASWQVAGTIGVGGTVGEHVGYAMRRGTLILATPALLPAVRFTSPVDLDTPFQALLLNRPEMGSIWPPAQRASENGIGRVSRGDRSIGGIGEVWQI